MGSLGNNGNGRDRDGGVDVIPATRQDLDTYRQAQAQLDRMRIPVLLHVGNPHERLYVAALDGTGNSMVNDNPDNWSVVAKIAKQVEELRYKGVKNIAGGYVEGTFTQEGLLRTPERLLDGRFGHSFGERVETAYYEFCVQAKAWLEEDPQAQIRVAGVGFSRGAEEVAALERMIEERGIRDPLEAKVVRDRDNVIQKIEYADKPLLVAPGKTLQAALQLDPVSTGVEDEDRRLPGSDMGTFEISALHDRRDLFKDNDHVPVGFSEDMRNLNVVVAGAHSDIGDTYDKNGLGTLSFNLSVEFLNRLSDRPYLEKRALPDDPAQYVVHRSDQHMHGLYSTSGYDRDGVRDRVEDQSPRPGIQRKDPINPELEKQVERRTGSTPGDPDRSASRDATQAGFQVSLGSPYRDWAYAALKAGDSDEVGRIAAEFSQSPQGQALIERGDQLLAQRQAQELQQQIEPEQQFEQQRHSEQARNGPVMSLMHH
jgi:hypothetical protein